MVSIVVDDNSVRKGAMDHIGAMRRSRTVIPRIRTSGIKQGRVAPAVRFQKILDGLERFCGEPSAAAGFIS